MTPENRLPFNKINSIIKRFELHHLPAVLRDVFGEAIWEEIKLRANDCKINLTNKKETALFCTRFYQEKQPTNEEFHDVFLTFIFLDGVYNYNRKNWNCFLPISKSDRFPNLNELEQRIIQVYRIEARNVRLFLMRVDNLVWVMTTERKLVKKKLTYGKSFHFVFDYTTENDSKYVFYQPEASTDENYILLFSQALGFQNFRRINLSGKDIPGMFHMLYSQAQISKEMSIFAPTNRVVIQGNIMDFTLGQARKEFSKKLFHGFSCLKKFEIRAQSQWRGTCLLNTPNVGTQLMFRTRGQKTIEDLFKELLKHGNVNLPLPSYIQQFSSSKRNIVQIKENIDRDENDDD